MTAKSIKIALERERGNALQAAAHEQRIWIPGAKDGENRAVLRKLKRETEQLKRWCIKRGITIPTADDVKRFKGEFRK